MCDRAEYVNRHRAAGRVDRSIRDAAKAPRPGATRPRNKGDHRWQQEGDAPVCGPNCALRCSRQLASSSWTTGWRP